nr:hypothetical protein PanWU01x14_309560 [Ipomoea batatas]
MLDGKVVRGVVVLGNVDMRRGCEPVPIRALGSVPLGKPSMFRTDSIQLISPRSCLVAPNSGKLCWRIGRRVSAGPRYRELNMALYESPFRSHGRRCEFGAAGLAPRRKGSPLAPRLLPWVLLRRKGFGVSEELKRVFLIGYWRTDTKEELSGVYMFVENGGLVLGVCESGIVSAFSSIYAKA